MCWRISYNSRQDSRQIRKSVIDKAFLLWYAETATVEVGLFFMPKEQEEKPCCGNKTLHKRQQREAAGDKRHMEVEKSCA